MKNHHADIVAARAAAMAFIILHAGVECTALAQRNPQAFTEEAAARGLVYPVRTWQGAQQFQGFGMVIVDLDNDGDQDLVIMGKAEGQVGFFENNGRGMFIDRSSSVNVVLSKGSGVAAADYNGDGLHDLYFTQEAYEPNVLLRNNGNFSFTDVSVAAGVDNAGMGEAAAWGDYDNDGWLDLYVANYTLPIDQSNPNMRNLLFHNKGDGTFENVAVQHGVADHGTTFSAAWTDMDRNGTIDLYCTNDRGHIFTPNKLWRNDGGTFTSLCPQSGACIGLWAMCLGVGDFDNNGFPDFYMTNMPAVTGYGGINSLLLNNGDSTFVEASQLWQVHQMIFSWAGVFFDYNNDGWLDLYVNNQSEANRLYRNNGTPPVTDVTIECAVAGSAGLSFNSVVGDLDGDGDLDLVLNNYGVDTPANVQLFINHEGNRNNWSRFNVIGATLENRHAIGANINLRSGTLWQWREMYAGGNNYKAQNETVLHFGLGKANIIDEIVVKWPGGSPTRTLTNYPVNKTWTIYPPALLGDADGNGAINVADLLAVINAWGPVQPGTEICDTDGNGVINVADLLFLINNWG